MARNLVICCDGTDNEFRLDKTNVARLAMALESDSSQLVYYDPGIGTLPEPTVWSKAKQTFRRLASLAFGYGLDRNIEEAYSFLMNYWETGDQVFLFGFSRGAYTVRVLAGLLHALGLLPRGNDNLVPYLMRLYGGIRDAKFGGDAEGNNKYWRLCNEFRGTFARPFEDQNSRRFPVHFVGVWDTVSSVGWAWEPRIYPFTFANPSIRAIRHAVSLDERRWFFRQNLFKPDVPQQELQELWFPGVHADVGGGYPEGEGGLWRVAFEWMVNEARKVGLRINEPRLQAVLNKAPAYEPWAERKHESLTGLWWAAEFFPKLSARSGWRLPRFGFGRHRFVKSKAVLHQSVLLRIRDTRVDYSPPNLSGSFIDRVRDLTDVPEMLAYGNGGET